MTLAVDAFAGPGGWSKALRDLGIAELGIELDGAACAIRDAARLDTVQGDVMLLAPRAFGPADGYIASPPCPTWSNGSGRPAVARATAEIVELITALGHGQDRRPASRLADGDLLVVEPLRWVLELRPRWVALEQVPAVLPIWQATAAALREHGYHAWTGILNARDYGVAQDRPRAILIASTAREPQRPEARVGVVRPVDVVHDWSPDDVLGFPRLADRGATVELRGKRYRARDLRSAWAPVFTLTSKSRSWVRFTTAGDRHPLELAEAAALQGFPCDWPFKAAGSRSAAFAHLANTVPPPLARAILEEAIA